MNESKKIKELKDKRDKLIEKQKNLIETLKTKHSEVYKWLIENDIDLEHLGQYSANIAAAFAIAATTIGKFPLEKHTSTQPELTPQVRIIMVDELAGKTEEEKAQLVWDRYGHVIDRVAQKYNLDPKIIFATIMIESGGNTFAVRREPQINDASYGLGQILFGTAVALEFEGQPQDLFDPEVNIELVGRYHRRNLDAYGGNLTPQQLTIAYNSGSPYNTPLPGHVDKFNRWFEKASDFVV